MCSSAICVLLVEYCIGTTYSLLLKTQPLFSGPTFTQHVHTTVVYNFDYRILCLQSETLNMCQAIG